MNVKPLHLKVKYIVFEDNLLSLFKRCFKCGYKSAQVTSTTIGTYVKLKQRCCACLNVFVWDSQPFIQNQPACNILLSAAILFSGAQPDRLRNQAGIHLSCKHGEAMEMFDKCLSWLQQQLEASSYNTRCFKATNTVFLCYST